MKRLITISFTLILLLAITMMPLPSAAQSSELTDLRTQNSKTYQINANAFKLVACTGPIHYKDDIDDATEPWKDIDTSIKTSDKPDWAWGVTKGLWHLLINEDTSIALGKDGNWIGFRLDGIAYLDASTKEYEILQYRQETTPSINGNTIRWDNVFFGANLEYKYIENKFSETIELTQQARDWLTANPPSSFGLNNQTTYLTFYMKCDWRSAYAAEDNAGNPINWAKDFESAVQAIKFRHPVKNYIVSMLPISYAYEAEAVSITDSSVPILKRFFQKDNNNWLLFGSQVTELNQLANGTIIFDPDVFYPDDDGGFDGYVKRSNNHNPWDDLHDGVGTGYDDSVASETHIQLYASTTNNAWNTFKRSIFSFPTANISDSAIVTAATFTVDGWGENDPAAWGLDINVFGCSPGASLDAGDYDIGNWSPGTPLCDTAKTLATWNTGGDNVFTLNAAGLAAINLTGNTNLGLMEATHDAGDSEPAWSSGANAYFQGYFAEQGGAARPVLSVTYSLLPSVTTLAATNVVTSSATISGNITDAGSGNCTARGFVWDTSSHGDPGNTAPGDSDYTDNYTEFGDYGAGTFSYNMTSLTTGQTYYFRASANNTAGWSYGEELNFTTAELGIQPPSSFTLTDLGATGIGISWVSGNNSTYTMIRVSRLEEVDNVSEGEQVYYGTGTSENVTGYSLDTTIYYFSAWGYDTDNVTHSSNYTIDSIGGDGMDEIGTQLAALNTLIDAIQSDFFGLAVMALFVTAVFAKNNILMYALGAPVVFVYGFTLASEQQVYSALWTSGAAVGLLGLVFIYLIATQTIGKRSR